MPLAKETLLAALEPALASLQQEMPGVPILDGTQMAGLAGYLALVSAYSQAAQLTALSTAQELAGELGAESLRLLAPGVPAPGLHVLDLGSGNGSPIVPLAIACPQADFIACEVHERRAAFLRQVAAQLRLGNLQVSAGRAEAVTVPCDVVTSRAFAPLPKLLPLATRLLGSHGELRGFLGAETAELQGLAPQQGFEITELIGYETGGKLRHVYRLVL